MTREARYEIKFVADEIFRARLFSWVSLHPFAFRRAYPPRRVNNIYFDTQDLQNYQMNLSGVSERTKVRYRWYGESPLPGPGKLELKAKSGGVGWKDSFKVSDSPYESGDSPAEFQRRLRSMVDPIAQSHLDSQPQVVLANRYWRHYFESRSWGIRVTIDNELASYDQVHRPKLVLTGPTKRPPIVIVEFKADSSRRKELAQAMQGFPIRVSKFSKYCMSLMSYT